MLPPRIMGKKRTFYPICIHLNNFIHQLNRMPSLHLRFPDLRRVPALVVDELQDV